MKKFRAHLRLVRAAFRYGGFRSVYWHLVGRCGICGGDHCPDDCPDLVKYDEVINGDSDG